MPHAWLILVALPIHFLLAKIVTNLGVVFNRSVLRGHLQTKNFKLNVIVTLKGGGGVFGK